jgi:hypothetical protein
MRNKLVGNKSENNLSFFMIKPPAKHTATTELQAAVYFLGVV